MNRIQFANYFITGLLTKNDFISNSPFTHHPYIYIKKKKEKIIQTCLTINRCTGQHQFIRFERKLPRTRYRSLHRDVNKERHLLLLLLPLLAPTGINRSIPVASRVSPSKQRKRTKVFLFPIFAPRNEALLSPSIDIALFRPG